MSDASPLHVAFSPARITAIARVTLTELIRLKIFYFLLIFSLLLIGSTAFLLRFSFQEQFQVLKDVALGAMSIFSLLLAVLTTSIMIPKDLEDRTLYTILAKPVPRLEYLMGKIGGVLILLAISILAMSGMFFLALWLREQMVVAELLQGAGGVPAEAVSEELARIRASVYDPHLITAVLLVYLKAAIFTSLALMLSTMSSSWIFTVILSVLVYFIGNFQGLAREYWRSEDPSTGWLTRSFTGLVALLFPDMQLFNLVDDIVVGTAVPVMLLMKTTGLGCLYFIVYFLVGFLLFYDREL